MNWLATLTNHSLHFNNKIQPVFSQRRHKAKTLNLVVLDTSGSSLKAQGVNNALGVTEWLYRQSYVQRHQFGLIRFGNNHAQWVVKPQQAGQSFKRYLPSLNAGGGTPLTAALELVSQVYQQTKRNTQMPDLRVYIMTDGISRSPIPEVKWQCPIQVIDIERSQVRLSKARHLAEQLNADYCHIDQLEIV